MKRLAYLALVLGLARGAFPVFGQGAPTPAADPRASVPPPRVASDSKGPSSDASAAFALDLTEGDKLVAIEGSRKLLAAWTHVVLATSQRLVVILPTVEAPWVDAIFELKHRKPEVEVVILCEQDGLRELSSKLLDSKLGKIEVYFRADIKAAAVGSPAGRLLGLVAVRDASAVLLATGEPRVHTGDFQEGEKESYALGWVVDSQPLGEAYERMLLIHTKQLANLRRDEPLLQVVPAAH